VVVWAIDCPALYDRKGRGPYLDPQGVDWPDNHLRFALLSRAAAVLCENVAAFGWRPDVLHAHDWHAGLAAAYLHFRGGRRPATVFTIHNMAFPGIFPATVLPAIGLPPEAFAVEGAEFHGKVSFLKAGMHYSDRVTTVSPTYAREILGPEFGCGFDGVLSARSGDLSGILNGIDDRTWDPASDPLIARTYDAEHLGRKEQNKEVLYERFGLARTDMAPMVGVVSRFTRQKGIDLILEAIPSLLAMGAQVVALGEGDGDLEKGFADAAASWPGRVGFELGYDEALAHLIQAGCDMLLVPSRFEPCGLTQLSALRYGTPPVVRRTGGLADSVVDARDPDGTGFVFDFPTSSALADAVSRAVAAYRKRRTWRALQRRGMERDFSWGRAAGEYRALYEELTRADGPA
jgi:starch synthase